jgi:hypothetical protein
MIQCFMISLSNSLYYGTTLYNTDQLSEMDEPSKLLPALSPDNFLKDNKDFPAYLLNNFNSEEETLPCKNRKQRNRVVRISGSMTPLSTKRTSIPYLDPKSPRCRLSRPGSCTVRVIPPLRGLERAVCCAYCGEGLFCLANVLRVNARGGREVEKEVEETRPHTAVRRPLPLHPLLHPSQRLLIYQLLRTSHLKRQKLVHRGVCHTYHSMTTKGLMI